MPTFQRVVFSSTCRTTRAYKALVKLFQRVVFSSTFRTVDQQFPIVSQFQRVVFSSTFRTDYFDIREDGLVPKGCLF